MLFGFFASGSSAPCARRLRPRTTLADAESTARMRRRMEKGEEERERGAGGEEGERHMCHQTRPHPLTASAASRRRGRRGRDGDEEAHMMCVARLLLAPHASPARRGKSIGGEEEVWEPQVLGMGRRRDRVRNELKHQCNFPDLPLHLLILPSGRGSAPSSRRSLIGVDDGVSQSPPDGARAPRAASPRCTGEDAGSLRSMHLNNTSHAAHNVVLC
ncbi:hypothetical protein B0H14DRAFT_3467834 [Mycena olivaceomarginata]|nr:hypothetical protein B0H14DRAFT_3467834 [Mycena olivaceomarginata]